jgi:hypothetical protein
MSWSHVEKNGERPQIHCTKGPTDMERKGNAKKENNVVKMMALRNKSQEQSLLILPVKNPFHCKL